MSCARRLTTFDLFGGQLTFFGRILRSVTGSPIILENRMERRAPVVENNEFRIRLDERLSVLREIRTMMEEKKRLVRGLKEAVAELDARIERTYITLLNSQGGGLPRPAGSWNHRL
jgi:hypothetical protein